jgi:translation initiation factor 1 (eIF-1/SUI1)
MAKWSERRNDKTPATTTTANPDPASSPFAALQALRASLPEAPPAPAAPVVEKVVKRFGEKVVVRLTRKGHGGKTVTIVSGVLPDARDALCTAMKKKLGTGARVDGDDIVIQGEVVDRVVVLLEAEGAKRVVRGS